MNSQPRAENVQPGPAGTTPRSSARLAEPSSNHQVWLGRFASLVAACTLVLIFAGGLVTSTGSGLAVPDWPLSYGQLFPPMVGGILFEHGHRLVAGSVAILMAILCAWILRKEPRPFVRRLAVLAMAAVLLQALLGGLTVLFLLPDAISIAHAGLAEIFFMLTVTLALVTSRGWQEAPAKRTAAGFLPLPLLAGATTVLVYAQILAGAVMRHTGAGLAIPDFPLSYGRLIPPSLVGGIGIHFAHRVGALLVTVAVLSLLFTTLRRHRRESWLLKPALLLGVLVSFQILLGALTIWKMKAVIPTTLHVAVGAAILATSLVLTLRAFRLYRLPLAAERPGLVRGGVVA